MSDCEEEPYPVGMRTSFSSSSDAHWSATTADDNYLPMKRSLSEFYRGECMTLESSNSDALEMVNVNLHSDRSDNRYDSIEIPRLNWNNGAVSTQVSDNGNSPAVSTRSNTSSSKSFNASCVKKSLHQEPHDQPQVDHSAMFSKHSSPGLHSLVCSEDSMCSGFVNIDYSKLQHIKRPFSEHKSEYMCTNASSDASSVRHTDDSEHDLSEMMGTRRVVADIRNNIPSVDTMGCYSGVSSTRDSTSLSPAVAGLRMELSQLKKRSPGVAKRLEATTPSRNEPSELTRDCVESLDVNEIEMIDKMVNNMTECSKNSIVQSSLLTCADASSAFEIASDSTAVNVLISNTESSCNAGMKITSSDEMKMNVDPFYYSDIMHNAILFDSFDDCATDDQTFTLSPDQTDWESDDAYGELDEDGRTSEGSVKPSSMPAVEDGLSGSDTDDHVASRRKLHQTELADTAVNGGASSLSESQVTEFFSGTVCSSSIIEKSQEDKVEKAIRDIYLAMERNRNSSFSSGAKASSPVLDESQGSVWVVRSSDSSVLAQLPEDKGLPHSSLSHQAAAQLDNHIAEQLRSYHNNENALTVTGVPLSTGLRDQDSLLQKYLARFSRSSRAYSAVPGDETDTAAVSDTVEASHGNGFLHTHSNGQRKPVAHREIEDADCVREDYESEAHRRRVAGYEVPCNHHVQTARCEADHGLEHGFAASRAMTDSSSTFNGRYSRRRHRSSSSASESVIYTEDPGDYNTDDETDELLERQYTLNDKEVISDTSLDEVAGQVKKSQPREALLPDSDNRTVLIEGVLFRTRYLGSTKIMSEGNPSKAKRMMQAQEAVGQIKAPDDDGQPSTEVDLFISAEKIMVLDTGHREVIMDHALQTISYIADIGDLLVIMVRLAIKLLPSPSLSVANGSSSSVSDPDEERRRRRVTICCHVFESDEAQLIAQSIGQAFQVAYAEFLKANGIEDPNLLKDVDYQEVLNQQQIFGEELSLFSSNDKQKEVKVVKQKGEPLGIVLVESGWGSMLPTVVLANLMPSGPAARTGRLNIGDQIMTIDGNSLVGLPLTACQNYVKATRHLTVVKLKLVSCAPVVEVLIKRPHVKYQLGFSVQNGVICSLLRGGIGERGGVRVGHRIIEINGLSMVAVPHEKIVHLLATSVGEIHMKTMQTSIFRLLTGQDIPHYI